MTTGQFPKRRETDAQAQFRAEAIAKRNEQDLHPTPHFMTRKELELWHLAQARRRRLH